MKRKNQIAAAASRNPSVVIEAFAPETEFVCDLDAWILLEAMGSPLCEGAAPGFRDAIIAALVFTDYEAVRAARKAGKLDELLAKATAGKRPADILPLIANVTAAIAAAFKPLDSGTDPKEKKSSPESDGGSP